MWNSAPIFLLCHEESSTWHVKKPYTMFASFMKQSLLLSTFLALTFKEVVATIFLSFHLETEFDLPLSWSMNLLLIGLFISLIIKQSRRQLCIIAVNMILKPLSTHAKQNQIHHANNIKSTSRPVNKQSASQTKRVLLIGWSFNHPKSAQIFKCNNRVILSITIHWFDEEKRS